MSIHSKSRRGWLGLFPPRDLWKRFQADSRGTAGIEFAIYFPVLAFAFVLMVDIAQTISAKYDAERKMRLAIEGVLRYGDDMPKVKNFANNSGNSLFPGTTPAPENTTTLTIDKYFVCRSGSIYTVYSASETPSCGNYETWFEIETAGSITGIFGKTFNFGTSVDVFSE